jgi:hypothetical protein
LFGIRRRRNKIIEKISPTDDVETAKDALENLQLKSNTTNASPYDCSETESIKTSDTVKKYSIFILFGTIGVYLGYKFVPIYIVSINYFLETNLNIYTFYAKTLNKTMQWKFVKTIL